MRCRKFSLDITIIIRQAPSSIHPRTGGVGLSLGELITLPVYLPFHLFILAESQLDYFASSLQLTLIGGVGRRNFAQFPAIESYFALSLSNIFKLRKICRVRVGDAS